MYSKHFLLTKIPFVGCLQMLLDRLPAKAIVLAQIMILIQLNMNICYRRP